MMLNINTIFFDFDGVVIDSEPLHAKAKKMVLDKYNIVYPETIFDDFKGRTDKVFFDHVSDSLARGTENSGFFQNSKKSVLMEIINELKLIEGFLPFLEKVKKNGIRSALVSSTSLHSLAMVDNLYHISELFDLVITEVDTRLHKPYPDPYLKALKLMQTTTHESVVIEDSPNGIISAKKAGCLVYGITSSFPEGVLLKAGADIVVNNYSELEKELNL
jgi:beta-phosphoglucomutase